MKSSQSSIKHKKKGIILGIPIINACALLNPVFANDNDEFIVQKLVIQMNQKSPEI